MKAVIGVGHMRQCLAGAHIFADLQFPDSSAVLVHTVEPVLPDGGFLPDTSTSPIVEIQNERRKAGEERLREVADDLAKLSIPTEQVVRFGNPAHEITHVADEVAADIVVAGSAKKGRLESFIMGSVTRALVVQAKRSILVGKTEVPEGRGLNVVLATDHSEYANRCIDALIAFAPKGIAKITVANADTTDNEVAEAFRSENPEGLTTEALATRKNETVRKKLAAIATETDSIVLRGGANEVVTAVMEQTKADLLILGAHGHGFLERLVMGSVAMHMVGNSPFNVLVLRV